MRRSDLHRGVSHVEYEWTQMAGCAARLAPVDRVRTPEENATLEALLLHGRCLINFLCGNYKGRWQPDDMKPADFLRASWTLPDEEMDRRLRGRLPIINRTLTHLSWRRVTDPDAVMWPTGLVAHEIHWSLNQFVFAVESANSSSASLWRAAANEAKRWMPPRRTDWTELRGFEPAPDRDGQPAEPIAVEEPEKEQH